MMGGAQGKLMKVAWGAAGGVAAKFGANFNPTFGPALGMGAVGYFGNNDTLLTLAGMSLSNLIPIGTGTTGTSGGYY